MTSVNNSGGVQGRSDYHDLANGQIDRRSQIFATCLCFPLCLPSALFRLTEHYVCGMENPESCPGMEKLAHGGGFCSPDRYEGIPYTSSPNVGTGLSRKNLDVVVVSLAASYLAIGGVGLAYKAMH